MQAFDKASAVTKLIEGLEALRAANRRPAVDEPANPFEEAVNEYDDLKDVISEVEALLKPLKTIEREKRDGIADSLRQYFGAKLKEGVNNYPLSNGRKLKFTHAVERKVDAAMVEVARQQYEAADDKPAGQTFDDLLRVKYELAKTPWKKLLNGGAASVAFSRCLETKFAASKLEVD
jgi:hypothetical protein